MRKALRIGVRTNEHEDHRRKTKRRIRYQKGTSAMTLILHERPVLAVRLLTDSSTPAILHTLKACAVVAGIKEHE